MIEIDIFKENHRFSKQTSAESVTYLPNVGGWPSILEMSVSSQVALGSDLPFRRRRCRVK